MIYEVIWTSQFKKSYKLAKKRGLPIQELHDIVEKLRTDAVIEQKYKDHQLTGNLNDFRECHIEPDWLLMYQIFENELILSATATGSYSDLFKK